MEPGCEVADRRGWQKMASSRSDNGGSRGKLEKTVHKSVAKWEVAPGLRHWNLGLGSLTCEAEAGRYWLPARVERCGKEQQQVGSGGDL
ncbi:hypothetical protein NDU88_005878 [Pleurodeles waltl]|uniref:Uncharacterized protein n=1 Tax=Pleurodeles waltl TaxID=8319 RepID=A0AAV7NNN3_PLEWA|nr:hypothetical protein NDU88_005878 [Pleurodeles waltl]